MVVSVDCTPTRAILIPHDHVTTSPSFTLPLLSTWAEESCEHRSCCLALSERQLFRHSQTCCSTAFEDSPHYCVKRLPRAKAAFRANDYVVCAELHSGP
ncbi:hypothetical protein PoB_001210900 [Plakobranchus ocellatus]|uniref:Uncharacterized protein n=1 Tax=Plakobranchus ocellatus TaxID=259542 RepID=A0AAV3YRB9_9GAST|nr:hypothetical protein PoB_001210900 [Plakobranchus ocellatus]